MRILLVATAILSWTFPTHTEDAQLLDQSTIKDTVLFITINGVKYPYYRVPYPYLSISVLEDGKCYSALVEADEDQDGTIQQDEVGESTDPPLCAPSGGCHSHR